MAKVEIIGRLPKVPAMLVEAIKTTDPALVDQIGEACVSQGVLKKAEKGVLVGATCLIKAREIEQEIERLEKEKKFLLDFVFRLKIYTSGA